MAKVLVIATLLAIGLSCVSSLDICQNQIDGTRLLYPTDCGKYIVCQSGQSFAIGNCNEGMHFNRLTSQCDEPIKAACDAEAIKIIIDINGGCCCSACECNCPAPGPATPGPETPGPETPGPETPGPETPGPETPGPETPGPETPGSETPGPETPGPGPSGPGSNSSCGNGLNICVGIPDYGSVYVNNSCHDYAICISGCAHVFSCPNNLEYDISSHSCNYPENVDCPYPHIPPSGPSAGPSGTKCVNPGKCANQPDGTQFADAGSNGYIVCQCECEIIRPCPAGLVYNDSLNVCGYPN